MHPFRQNRNRGFGLLMTMLILTILAGFASTTFRRAHNQAFLVGSQAQHYQALILAKAGVNLARAGLLLDTNDRDDLEEDWALLSQASQIAPIPLGNGFVSVQIVDEDSKRNLNTMPEQELREFLNSLKLKSSKQGDITGLDIYEPELANELTDAFLDWIDYDTNVRPQGAEEREYRGESFKYFPHNQPIASLGELLWIKGFTPDMLFGRKGNPPLVDILTVFGGGKININTASDAVLRAFIAQYDEYNTSTVLDAVRENRPYQSVGQATSLLSSYLGNHQFDKKIKIKSEYFRIVATGIVGKVESVVEAVVKRNANKCDILLWMERPKIEAYEEISNKNADSSGT